MPISPDSETTRYVLSSRIDKKSIRAVEATSIVLLAFIGKLTERLKQLIFEPKEEETQLSKALWCLTQLQAKMAYYPLSKLISGISGETPKSYLKRIDGLRKKAEKDPELAEKIACYDALGNSQTSSFPEFSEWPGWLGSKLLEVVITDSLEYLLHHLELRKDWEEAEKQRLSALQTFENSADGKALLQAFAGFEAGLNTFLNEEQLRALIYWRNPVTTLVDGKDVGELRNKNPELDALLTLKGEHRKLSSQLKEPGWSSLRYPDCWRFPFLAVNAFVLGDDFASVGLERVSLALRLLEVSDSALERFKTGEVSGDFRWTGGRGPKAPVVTLLPDARLLAYKRLSSFCYEVTDPRSTLNYNVIFKGLRFHRTKKGRWDAKLTFEPKLELPANLTEAILSLKKSQKPEFAPGTVICTFSPTISGRYFGGEGGQVGWFMAFGLGEPGEKPRLLYSTKVTPHLQFPKGRGERRGKSRVVYGQAKGVSLEKLREIRELISKKQKQSGKGYTDGRATLAPGDFRKLWTKLIRCSEELRAQTAEQVMRLCLRVRGELKPQGALKAADVIPPPKVLEWEKRYPGFSVLLAIPSPMGSAHQPWKGKRDNKVLHLLGPSSILNLVMEKAPYFRQPLVFLSKKDLGKRCPACGAIAKSGSELGQLTFSCCERGKKGWPRGAVFGLNLLWRLFTPLPKKKSKEAPAEDETEL